jgi:hypothetical protein
MRLAFACNLHNVTSPYDFKRFPKSMLPPPTNQSDVDDRIAVFWTVWMVYKIGTVCSSDWDIPEEVLIKISGETLSVSLMSAVAYS